MIRKSFYLYMYSSSVLGFYNISMAVRVMMCVVDILIGTVGLRSGFGSELPGS
jgi:hypothetical protein